MPVIFLCPLLRLAPALRRGKQPKTALFAQNTSHKGRRQGALYLWQTRTSDKSGAESGEITAFFNMMGFVRWHCGLVFSNQRQQKEPVMLRNTSLTALSLALFSQAASAQDTTYTLYGTPGLIEMPTAQMAPDGQVTASLGLFEQQQRANFSFQLTPRLSGLFRYAGIPQDKGVGTDGTFERSFDLRYRFLDEGRFGAWSPAVAVGLQDFLGTGDLSSEYVVASKSFGDTIVGTLGLGWGRFGTQNGFTNPLGIFDASLETRPDLDYREGGEISTGQFFRGDAAFFGGVAWQYSDKITLKAEYSSDAYVRENNNDTIDTKSPINLGLTYHFAPGITADVAYLYGAEIAAGLTFDINPRTRAFISGVETAPIPVRVRDSAAAASWGTATTPETTQALQAVMKVDGLRLLGLDVTGTTARVRYSNTMFRSEAQALGRVARIMSQVMPDGVTRFTLEPVQAGIALSATTINRSDLEQLENRPTAATDLLARAVVGDAAGAAIAAVADDTPAFTWGLSPYASLILFNGDAPVQVDVGLDLRARYEITPNLIVAGAIRQSLLGKRELAEVTETPNSYPNVRTDGAEYGIEGKPVMTHLTMSHFGRPAKNLYSRVSLGYLEQMYGGVSTEVLWKPVDSPLALGVEVNYARQRDTDMLFGFQDFETVTGHVSGYYSFDNGFHGQVDVGRYLAGDWGATFALDREFDNGWKVGSYFTLTDMPFEEFGEGSFDKGIRITVPADFFAGNATRKSVSTSLASLTRDGGAKLDIDGRLYDIVRDGHTAGPMGNTWGRIWR